MGAGHLLTICSLIWEQGALLFTAAKLLAKALLTAQLLCRACWEVPSRPATARHTGDSLARAWNRLLSSSLADGRGEREMNPPRESYILVTVFFCQTSLLPLTHASSFLCSPLLPRASLLLLGVPVTYMPAGMLLSLHFLRGQEHFWDP